MKGKKNLEIGANLEYMSSARGRGRHLWREARDARLLMASSAEVFFQRWRNVGSQNLLNLLSHVLNNLPSSTAIFHVRVCSTPVRSTHMSSTLNVVQMEANRRNAQHSSGPRSEAGKKISSLNALRHGLTSRVVVLPSEDLDAYKTFSEKFLASLAPETFPESQCAQTIIDTQWRLNRVRSLEEGMLAHGHGSPAGQQDYGHPQVHAALTQAAVFLEHSQAFVNLSMHEQRLYRILTAASKSLEDMKAKRTAARQAALDEAVALSNLNKMLGLPSETPTIGFVFSPEEIETESRRHRLLL